VLQRRRIYGIYAALGLTIPDAAGRVARLKKRATADAVL
jgi:hypothetical protein